MRLTRVRQLAPFAFALVLAVALPSDLWAGTSAPPPFEWINGGIRYIQRAAIPFVILLIMLSAIGWLVAKNSSGIVEFMGRAFMVLTILLGGAAIITAVGFQGGVL